MTNMFEFIVRNKIRFVSSRGLLSVEQLWDVPLRSKDDFNLDAIAKSTNKALKELSEESFVETKKSSVQVQQEAALEVVKYVIETKLDEEQSAKKRAENQVEKKRLMEILAEKQDGKLSALSEKEIQKRIAALEE